jgi:hypothetical protein
VPKTVTVDFWDVLDLGGSPFDLLPIIESAGAESVQARMKKRTQGQTDYLAEVFPKTTVISGTVALIRTQDWPGTVDTPTGALDALSLPPGKEVTEEMSFHFDRDLRTLATQRHRMFRASRLIDLLRDITGAKFVIQPKLQEDAWARFQEMTRLGKVELKIAGPIHHPQFSRTVPAMAQLIEESKNAVNAMEIGLSLSMGHAKNQSLDIGIMRRVINYSRQADAETKSLTVSGSMGDDTSETIDFIHDRLIFAGKVDYAEKHLDRAKCRQLLIEAIETHQGYLKSLL